MKELGKYFHQQYIQIANLAFCYRKELSEFYLHHLYFLTERRKSHDQLNLLKFSLELFEVFRLSQLQGHIPVCHLMELKHSIHWIQRNGWLWINPDSPTTTNKLP